MHVPHCIVWSQLRPSHDRPGAAFHHASFWTPHAPRTRTAAINHCGHERRGPHGIFHFFLCVPLSRLAQELRAYCSPATTTLASPLIHPTVSVQYPTHVSREGHTKLIIRSGPNSDRHPSRTRVHTHTRPLFRRAHIFFRQTTRRNVGPAHTAKSPTAGRPQHAIVPNRRFPGAEHSRSVATRVGREQGALAEARRADRGSAAQCRRTEEMNPHLGRDSTLSPPLTGPLYHNLSLLCKGLQTWAASFILSAS